MELVYRNPKNEELREALDLWNSEMGLVFPIDAISFDYNVTNYPLKDALFVYDNKKLVAFIILKEFKDLYLESYNNILFISLFFVSRSYRRNGIGTKLIEYAVSVVGKREISVGKDIHNFFPGIPNDFDNLTDNFLEKRGFTCSRYTHDLICLNPKKQDIKNKDVIYKICTFEEKDKLVEFVKNNNWKRWAYEVEESFKEDKNNKCFLIGILDDKIISYCKVNNLSYGRNSYNMMWKMRFNNLGGIGPLGVDRELRGKHLGGDIIKASINYLIDTGCSELMIDWTGLMELYRKYGFEVWKAYKYTYKNGD